MEKIKRPLIAHFLDVAQAEAYSGAEWKRMGLNVTDGSIDYGAQTQTEQDIISDSASTEITGYQPTMAVSQQCTKDEPIFDFITTLRRKRATLGDAHTWMLNVDLWDVTGTGDDAIYAAEVQEVSIGIGSYGGAGGETPVQDFTINFIGDPVSGTVTIVGGEPLFEAS